MTGKHVNMGKPPGEGWLNMSSTFPKKRLFAPQGTLGIIAMACSMCFQLCRAKILVSYTSARFFAG